MGVQGSDFIVRPADTGLGVRRVERDAEAHDLGRRESEERKGSAKRQPMPEAPQEVAVEVSEEYLAEHEAQAMSDTVAEHASTIGGGPHLDIEA